MKLASFAYIISVFILIFSITLCIPIGVGIYFHEPISAFLDTGLITTAFTVPCYFIAKKFKNELNRIDGFIMVVLSWVVLCLIAAIPFKLSLPASTYSDCLFEAISGLTTTGAEIFASLDSWQHSLKIYHQFLQFLGGLGIIVLGIAIMPLLGQNISYFVDKDPTTNSELRLAPKISSTAKQLWKLYISVIFISVICYHFAGLPWFDAWCYGFTTFSTGGFGIFSDSLMHYNSQFVNLVACFFALLGSMNFAVIFATIQKKQLNVILRFNETKCFFKYLFILLLAIAFIVYKSKVSIDFISWLSSTIMMITTTGLQTAEFHLWPSFLPMLLLISALIGGSSGSTTGGIKMARILLIHNEISAMFKQLIHPRSIDFKIKQKHSSSIHGFLAINVIVYLISIIIMIDMGYDLEDAFAAVTACLTNVGVSIASFANGYNNLTEPAKILLSLLMLLGRLEATTILILFTPYFWREL